MMRLVCRCSHKLQSASDIEEPGPFSLRCTGMLMPILDLISHLTALLFTAWTFLKGCHLTASADKGLCQCFSGGHGVHLQPGNPRSHVRAGPCLCPAGPARLSLTLSVFSGICRMVVFFHQFKMEKASSRDVPPTPHISCPLRSADEQTQRAVSVICKHVSAFVFESSPMLRNLLSAGLKPLMLSKPLLKKCICVYLCCTEVVVCPGTSGSSFWRKLFPL